MKYTLLALTCLSLNILFGQSSGQYIIPTQGGHTEGNTMALSWTIGDVVTNATVIKNGTLRQGFQQPQISIREIYSTPSEAGNETTSIHPVQSFSATAYPNPVGDEIHLNVENSEKTYLIEVYNHEGKLMSYHTTNSAQEVINVSTLPASQYILRLSIIDSPASKVFQFIKSR